MSMRKIMVCVTVQKTCQRLIQMGAMLKEREEDEMFVVHVAPRDGVLMSASSDNEALELLYNSSKEAGASMSVLRSDNIRATLEEFVLQNSITHIIMGSAGPGAYNKFYEHLRRRFPDVYILADCEDGREGCVKAKRRGLLKCGL